MKFKNQQLIVVSLIIVIIVSLEFNFRRQKLVIIPSKFNGKFVTYSDTTEESANYGNSLVRIDSVTNAGLFYSYKLSKQFPYYYAGIMFEVPQDSSLDLRGYSKVTVDLDVKGGSSCRFFILTDESGISEYDDPTTWRHLKQIIPFQGKRTAYTISMNQFATPQWWFETYKTTESNITSEPLAKCLGFKVESGEGEETDYWENIHIRSIKFYNPIPQYVRSIQLVLFMLLLVILAFWFGIMRQVQLGKYKPIILGNLFDEELELITNYIGENYSNPELSLSLVATAIALHQDKVAALIKQGYGQSFKQYLNRLRLTEAQRLLRSTDRQISEIAFAVGYNSVTHFNRVFKQYFSCTPREFRT